MSFRYGGSPTCPRCSKAVYMAEQITGPGGSWHKSCLTCKECGKRLDSYLLTERNGEAYCKTCHSRKWGPKGYGFAGGASFLTTETKTSAEISGNNSSTPPKDENQEHEQPEDWLYRRTQRVDRQNSIPTYSAPDANPQPEPETAPQARDPAEDWLVQQQKYQRDLPCSSPYNPYYSNTSTSPDLPRRGSLTSSGAPSPVSPTFSSSRPSVYRTLAGDDHADGSPLGPSPTTSTGSSSSQSNLPRTGRGTYGSSSSLSSPYSANKMSYVPKKLGFQIQNDLCRHCGKVVYAAEMVLGAGNKYHKLCLKCCSCNKLVDSSTMVDRGEQIYCRPCYSKEFGPKGYGYAGGAAFLTTEGTTR